ncbi:MAG: DUF58 domain-containing protein [Candidatus Melainabacteria bacterium]|nr:DUF58 domain-containing protein [Candidatus Melainabacteria bacterium]
MVKKATLEAINEALRMTVSTPIPTGWRTVQPYPGGGARKSRARGPSGWDLATRLEYEPGADNIRDIDWPATAQTGGQQVLVSHKLEPRDLKIYILADVQPTMDFGTFRTTKRLLGVELAASVMKSAAKSEDKVAFMAFSSERVEALVTPRSPQKAMMPALVSMIEGGNVTRWGSEKQQLSGLQRVLKNLPSRKAMVVIISDFLNMTDADREALKKAALFHDVICLCVQDRRERELPAGIKVLGFEIGGLYTLRDLRTGQRKSIWLSKGNREKFAENFRRHQESLETFFRKSHIDFGIFSTEEGVAGLPKLMRVFSNHR